MTSSANTSRTSFSFAKFYDRVTLQQGVPIADSDWNELADVLRASLILVAAHGLGDMRLPPAYGGSPGYAISQAAAPANNFAISAGYALVGGVLVPTTTAEPPVALDYTSDSNIMGSGTVTSRDLAHKYIYDTDQYWQSFHNLVGGTVKFTSGTESGNSFTITAAGATRITVSTAITNVQIGDTYIVKPPALTNPGAPRTDEVYLMVWWDDIAEGEDVACYHDGVGVETCHREARRWCVRVAVGGTAIPVTPATPAVHGFGARYYKLATLNRINSNDILTAYIVNETSHATLREHLENVSDPHNVLASQVTSTAYSWISAVNVQTALQEIVDDLALTTGTNGTQRVGQSAIGSAPLSLSAGTQHSINSQLLVHINDHLNDTTAAHASTAVSGSVAALWADGSGLWGSPTTVDGVEEAIVTDLALKTNLTTQGAIRIGAYAHDAGVGVALTTGTVASQLQELSHDAASLVRANSFGGIQTFAQQCLFTKYLDFTEDMQGIDLQKEAGTGAQTARSVKIAAQPGKAQTGGAANNNGSNVSLRPGPPGYGGAGSIGLSGRVDMEWGTPAETPLWDKRVSHYCSEEVANAGGGAASVIFAESMSDGDMVWVEVWVMANAAGSIGNQCVARRFHKTGGTMYQGSQCAVYSDAGVVVVYLELNSDIGWQLRCTIAGAAAHIQAFATVRKNRLLA